MPKKYKYTTNHFFTAMSRL